MVNNGRITAILGAILIMSGAPSSGDEIHRVSRYPEAPRSETADDYHGRRIQDPYRPLEDPDAEATRSWVEAENRITFAFLESIPARVAIRERLTALWDYEKTGAPGRREDATSTPSIRAFKTRASSTRATPWTVPGGSSSIPTPSRPTAPWPWRGPP